MKNFTTPSKLLPSEIKALIVKARTTQERTINKARRVCDELIGEIQDRCPHEFLPSSWSAWGFHEDSKCRHCGMKNPD